MVTTTRRAKRRELVAALRRAEALMRQLGSDWRDVPGYLRLPMLSLANRLARLLEREDRRHR